MKKDILLESKIQTPDTSSSFLVRERLLRRIHCAEERLIVVSAGMGYGKTVLLTHYSRRYPGHCAWYHISSTDNDIMIFARYLYESVSRVMPELDFDLTPYLALEQNEALIHSLALEFSAALSERGSEELFLVLDDFQEMENEWVFQFLNILLETGPEGLRLVLCTKSAPPAFCARYLMEHRALVFGSDQLAFNLEEVKLMIREYTVPEELESIAQSLLQDIEGWPAGISFAILYFHQRRELMREQDLEQACRQSYLWDYFMHELFRKLPYELQKFLVTTSVLEFLRPDVCNELMGIDNASSLLSYLMQENLFILQLSGRDHIYRYHSLFRSFLAGQLQEEQRRQLCRKASDFFLRTPDKSRAVEYAIACGDGKRLLSAVEIAGRDALQQGRLDTVRRWLEELQRSEIAPTREVMLLEGEYLDRTGSWEQALQLAEQVIAASKPDEQYDRTTLGAQLLRARIAREHISLEKSLELLDALSIRLRRRRGLSAVRKQIMEMMVYDLLDLRQSELSLKLLEADLTDSSRRCSMEEQIWNRELTVICYCATGQYRRAMQLYVILRSSGAGASAAHYIHLYLALSGRPAQALARLNRVVEEASHGVHAWVMKDLLLAQTLVEQISALDGEPPQGERAIRRFIEGMAPGAAEAGLGRVFVLLGRALLNEELSEDEEDQLFGLTCGEYITAQDGARWLAIRRRVLRGDRDRALELCRRTCADRGSWCGCEKEHTQAGRTNAFLAFITLEEALLLAPAQPGEAAELLHRCWPYLQENGLICPGLSTEEHNTLERLSGKKLEDAELSDELSTGEAGEQRLSVHCFGHFQVILPDGKELHWRTRKAQELFAYLFHMKGEPVDRERLLDALWPKSNPENATSLLHTSLYSIRKALTPFGLDQLILREKKCYRMDVGLLNSDLTQLEQICEQRQLGDIPLSQLYRGPYMEDIGSEWAEGARAYYEGEFLKASRAIGEERMDSGDFSTAADCLRSALDQEPYDEALAGLLLQCYSAMGQIKNAMLCYKRMKETLKQELDTEPGEELTRIYRECLLRKLDSGRAML